jgi:diguanylate cyclase (GGDEF)-like protein
MPRNEATHLLAHGDPSASFLVFLYAENVRCDVAILNVELLRALAYSSNRPAVHSPSNTSPKILFAESFSIPLRTEVKAKSQIDQSNQRRSREQARVLVITDESMVEFPATLEAAGISVVGVGSAIAAPILLRRVRPQLVIANIPFKGMTARELAQMLALGQDFIPLVLAGEEKSTLELRRAAMSAGAFDYFQLPTEVELLILNAIQLINLHQRIDRLRGEADLDHLTGLANRRRFRVALSREVERWRRYDVPCALLLLDIDHLKKINDTLGHPAGDLVIREVAETLIRASRDNDTAARLGGEEFALLLAGIDDAKAESAANRLRAILAEQSIEGVGNISVSIGVAACPAHANSEGALYAASDEALYVAKNKGRNRVAVAPRIRNPS